MNDFTKATKKTEQLRSRCIKSGMQRDLKSLLEYYQELIDLEEAQKLTSQETAYLITDTMFFPVVNENQQVEELTLDAGQLELPDSHLSEDRTKLWNELKQRFIVLKHEINKKK